MNFQKKKLQTAFDPPPPVVPNLDDLTHRRNHQHHPPDVVRMQKAGGGSRFKACVWLEAAADLRLWIHLLQLLNCSHSCKKVRRQRPQKDIGFSAIIQLLTFVQN